jgi:anti-anti-sigma factor
VDDDERSLSEPGDPLFSVAKEVIGTDIVLRVTGEIDLASRELFESHLANALVVGCRVVLDLGGVEFMDSTGLNVILRCHRRAQESEGALLIRSPSSPVQRLFESTGVIPHLTFDRHCPNATDETSPDL